MAVVLRFDSLDDRNRATLVMPSIEAAVGHIRDTFDLASHTLDEEGEEPLAIDELPNHLRKLGKVRLFDQASWHSRDMVEISCAQG